MGVGVDSVRGGGGALDFFGDGVDEGDVVCGGVDSFESFLEVVGGCSCGEVEAVGGEQVEVVEEGGVVVLVGGVDEEDFGVGGVGEFVEGGGDHSFIEGNGGCL